MGLLDNILNAIDSQKRQYRGDITDIWQNGLLGMQTARDRLESPYKPIDNNPQWDIAALSSVMPGVQRNAADALLGRNAEDVFGGNLLGGVNAAAQVARTKIIPAENGLLGDFPTTTMGRILNKTRANKGYSVNLATGEVPSNGLLIAQYADTDPRNFVLNKLTQSDLAKFATTNEDQLAKADRLLGTWINPDNGKVYVGVSRRFEPDQRRLATKTAERTKQIAGWDMGKMDEFPIGNWEDFVRSPQFQQRMDTLAGEGSQYMATHPTREWWDMHGTKFQDVYGQQNLPQVAGFTASTAPNTDPLTNVRVMSEYMRRHIKGEPIIQPQWRAGADTLTQAPGTKLPMEQGRVRNLTKASQGLLGELRQDKVREEAAAMMGDPNAFVGDRWWARVAEDPAKGIFTASQEGVLEPGKQFLTLKDSVAEAAARHGRDLRNFSADVWAAIRERVKNTGELFGQKYDASAIRGESKGYADHLVDAIKAKSDHLGITVKEMEDRLRKGDANLLSMMLASPVLYGAYQEIVGESPYREQ